MRTKTVRILILVFILSIPLLSSCSIGEKALSGGDIQTTNNTSTDEYLTQAENEGTSTPHSESQATGQESGESTLSFKPENVSATLPVSNGLDPADWRNWPVIPVLTQNVQEIYTLGQKLGRDPTAFSIFGDCQSTPESFLGLYDIDQTAFNSLPTNLQETVSYFGISLTRQSPTAKPGTTTGALLWIEWHESKYGCQATETPVQCELRLNNPSFVLLAVGTHYESRNEYYLRKIIEELLSLGIVPILSTKADNREGDHSINLQTAQLAIEYNIPMWNFWALSQDLPENGLYIKEGEEHLGAIYFTDELKDRHRISALETLHAIWKAANSGK